MNHAKTSNFYLLSRIYSLYQIHVIKNKLVITIDVDRNSKNFKLFCLRAETERYYPRFKQTCCRIFIENVKVVYSLVNILYYKKKIKKLTRKNFTRIIFNVKQLEI